MRRWLPLVNSLLFVAAIKSIDMFFEPNRSYTLLASSRIGQPLGISVLIRASRYAAHNRSSFAFWPCKSNQGQIVTGPLLVLICCATCAISQDTVLICLYCTIKGRYTSSPFITFKKISAQVHAPRPDLPLRKSHWFSVRNGLTTVGIPQGLEALPGLPCAAFRWRSYGAADSGST